MNTLSEVMMHRRKQHEEEIPICNDIKEGRRCSRSDRCWFSHVIKKSHVSSQSNKASKNVATKSDNHQGFWPTLPTSQPPDQIQKIMEMMQTMMTEMSQIKQQMNTMKTNQI